MMIVKNFALLAVCLQCSSQIHPQTQHEQRYCLQTSLRVTQAGYYRVIDGDTLEIFYHHKRRKVRLIGVDTPETKHPMLPVQCLGRKATRFTKAFLGHSCFRLKFEHTAPDRFDRLLAYVVRADGQILNEMLISKGYGRYLAGFPFALSSAYRALDKAAAQAQRGGFAACHWQALP